MNNKTDTICVRMKPKKFFQDHAFRDIDGAYWESAAQRDYYDEGKKLITPWADEDFSPSSVSSRTFDKIVIIPVSEVEPKGWAIESLFPREQYPEYYI